MYMDQEGMTLASEILAELKASARRWFMAFLIMLGIEIATVCGFLWYLSLPAEESTTTQTIEAEDSENINQHIGGDYESDTNSPQSAQSNTQ